MNYFSLNLKHLRNKKKLGQIDIAKYFDIKRSAISNWETGIAHPKVEDLIKLAKYFDVTIDALLFEDLSKNGEEDTGNMEAPDVMQMKEPVEKYGAINNQEKNIQNLTEANLNLSEVVRIMSENQIKLTDTIERLLDNIDKH